MKRNILACLVLGTLVFGGAALLNNNEIHSNPEITDENSYFYPAYSTDAYNEPKYKTGITTSNGTYTQKNQTYDRMNVSTTWNSYRGDNVRVAVIDTGIVSSHEDFSGTNISSRSYNVNSSSTNITDTHGHGTDSAACVAAAINSVGGLGMSPNAEIIVYKASDANNGFSASSLNKAIRRAISDHVDVINMSVQGYAFAFEYSYVEDYDGKTYGGTMQSSLTSSSLQTAINEAHDAGITVVAAAGNYNTSYASYPAANNHVIAVGSTSLTSATSKAGFSNGGDWVDVVAPGYVVVPSISSNTAYRLWWGTSFSAPLVSGAIALYKSKYPSATPDEIEARLKATCSSVNFSGSGAGQVDVANFLNNGAAETWVHPSNMALPSSFDVSVDQTKQITPTFTPSNTTRQTCYWSSSNTNIASVDAFGNVTGKSTGVTTITAISVDGEIQKSTTVNVGGYVPATAVTLSPSSCTLDIGDTQQLTWELTPSNCSDDSVIFDSSNESVTTVDENGLITAVGQGSATITVLTADGCEDTCEVTVNPPAVVSGTYTIGWGSASGTAGTYTNFTATSGSVSGLLSFSTAKNSGTNDPYYTGSLLRLYYNSGGNGCSITLTPTSGVTITGAVVYSNTQPSVKYSVNGGTKTSASYSSGKYTISNISASSSLMIQNVNTSNVKLDITKIEISYTKASLSSLSLNTSNVKTSFTTAESFTYSGLVVTANYTSGSSIVLSSGYTVSTPDLTSAGNKTVTVTYTEDNVTKTATYQITVTVPVLLESISISGNYKTSFVEGDSFTFGGTVTAYYDNSTSEVVTSQATFSGYNMTTISNQTVTVSYGGKSTSYDITVGAGTLSSISVSGCTTTYSKGATFSFDGTLTATMENGYQKVFAPTSVTSPDMSTGGVKTITVSLTYNGKTVTTTYDITVNAYRTVIEEGNSVVATITYPSSATPNIVGTGFTVSPGGFTEYSSRSLRLGSGSNTGSITVTSTSSNIRKVVVNAKSYGSDSNVNLRIGGSDNTITSSYADYVKEYTTATNSVAIATTANSKRAYVQSITIYTYTSQDISHTEDCIGLESFITQYMHMDYTSNLGYCKDNEHHYYATAKSAFNSLNTHQRTLFTSNSAYALEWARLSAWATANSESLNSSNQLSEANKMFLLKDMGGNYITIIVVISLTSLTFYGVLKTLRKKEN